MERERIIALSDLNCFYASVEMMRNPRLREVPMAVCGCTEQRHGIVLTANYIAKRMGVKTAMSNNDARKLVPNLRSVPPHYDDYIQFSGFVRDIYKSYSDRIEGFGLDENWIDLTGCVTSFKQAELLIEEIRSRVKRELGLTVSIGLSFNKVFAKLGSDMKKPDACTVIPKDKFKEMVWPLPVEELLYVGRATKSKLNWINVFTIGDLANVNYDLLRLSLGKAAAGVLQAFARGEDKSMVAPTEFESPVKSVGNSTTCPRDLVSDDDVRIMFYVLAESVGARLMELGLSAMTVEFSYVTKDMTVAATRQKKLEIPTNISGEIANAAFKLFKEHYSHWPWPLRKVGVRGSTLVKMDAPRQFSLWENPERILKNENLERAINMLRARYGNKIVQRAIMYTDPKLSSVDAKRDNLIHPVGVFNGGMSEAWGAYTATR
jgi:DNA polymerase-4